MFLKKIILIILLLFSCSSLGEKMKMGKLGLMNGRVIPVFLAISSTEQNNGLSGWKPAQLKKDQGMLFLYKKPGIRSFWMPNTYFNLDIIYLSSDFKVLKIDRNAPHHPSYKEPVPRLPTTISHHVLEIHAKSELSQQIEVGTNLKWLGKKPIKEILQDIRQ